MSCPIYIDRVEISNSQFARTDVTATLKAFTADSLENLYYEDGVGSYKFDIQSCQFQLSDREVVQLKKSTVRSHKISDLMLAEVTKLKLNNYELSNKIAHISLGSMDFADFIQQENLGSISALWDLYIDWKDYKISRNDKEMRFIGLLK
jgi:hypothetical protein